MKLRAGMTISFLLLACCHRNKKPPIKVVPLVGESSVLPRAASEEKAAPPDIVVTNRTLSVKGNPRTYLLVAPKTPKAGLRPLVLVYHGDGGSAASLHEGWKFERVTQNDAFVVYPDGIGSTFDLETKKDNKDLDFADALVDELVKTLPIDKTHVFATGYSNGGFFTNVLACHRPNMLRGFAGNAGGAPYNQDDKWPNGFPKCPGQQAVPMIALHGDRDFTVGLDSGRYSAEYWAYVNGCSDSEMEQTGYAECTSYRGCKKPVVWCSVSGLGHWVWDENSAATWAFFQRL